MDSFLPTNYSFPDTPPEFITHKNYVECLSDLSTGLKLKYRNRIQKKAIDLQGVRKKLTLIKLTKQSIDSERKIIITNSDYAQVCVSWISVKSYYLLYNLMLVLKYLISCQTQSLNTPHNQLLNEFIDCLKTSELVFSEDKFNKVMDANQILTTKVESGANMKIISYDVATRVTQILKILCKYDLEEFRRKEKIASLRKKIDKSKYNAYKSGLEISLISFFYWYRIKANYRDLEFIDGVPEGIDLAQYYLYYHKLTCDFYEAFKELINSIAAKRLGNDNPLIL